MNKLLIFVVVALGLYAFSRSSTPVNSDDARRQLSPTLPMPVESQFDVLPGEVIDPRIYPMDYQDKHPVGDSRIRSGWIHDAGPLVF